MTGNSYDSIAEQWHANLRGQVYVDRVLGYVDKILEGLPLETRILDLGCGTGDPIARHVIERGFHLTGIDQSEKMLEIARREFPQAEFFHGDMISLQLPIGFGAAIAWDSVFHVDRDHHSDIFHKLANSLVPGGRLLLSVGGTADNFASEMYGHQFYYSGYAPEVSRELLEAQGFEVELWEVDDPTSRGHIAVIAKRIVDLMPQKGD